MSCNMRFQAYYEEVLAFERFKRSLIAGSAKFQAISEKTLKDAKNIAE